jgi:septal ring factor EnvC (AmiA/AmiB activator)
MFDFLKKKKKVIIRYNSEDLDSGEKLQSVFNENAYLKGQLARIKSEIEQKREKGNDEEKEQERIEYLNNESKSLRQKELQPFSLFEVFKYQMRSKKNPKKFPPIKFTTFDGGSVLGNVDNFVITPDGGLGAVSNGEVIWASRDINRVFYWITGLSNFAKNRMIPLCINSNNQYEPNLQTEEVSELVKSSDGKFKINRFNKKPLYEELADLHEEIGDLSGELENVEGTLTEQQKEIKEKDREVKLHKSRAEKAESELSMALNKVSEIEMANGEIIRQNMSLISLKEINEGLIDSMEKIVAKWSGKIEDKFGRDIREGEWEELKSKLNWAKQNLPTS